MTAFTTRSWKQIYKGKTVKRFTADWVEIPVINHLIKTGSAYGTGVPFKENTGE